MIDFGLCKGHLVLIGMVCSAALVAFHGNGGVDTTSLNSTSNLWGTNLREYRTAVFSALSETRRMSNGDDIMRECFTNMVAYACLETSFEDWARKTAGVPVRVPDGSRGESYAFRRIAFNVAVDECDDHTKNFAFMLKEGGDWQLAPAYDLTGSEFPSDDPWSAHGGMHQLSVNGKRSGIRDDDLLTMADRFAIGTAPRILREVKSALTPNAKRADEAPSAGAHPT